MRRHNNNNNNINTTSGDWSGKRHNNTAVDAARPRGSGGVVVHKLLLVLVLGCLWGILGWTHKKNRWLAATTATTRATKTLAATPDPNDKDDDKETTTTTLVAARLDFAIVTLYDPKDDRSREFVAAMSCVCRRRGIFYYAHSSRPLSWRDKTTVLQRYLSWHSWIVYADAPALLVSETELQRFLQQLQNDDYHVALTEANRGAGLDARVFCVKQSPLGGAFLSHKKDDDETAIRDEEALHLSFLQYALPDKDKKSHYCQDMVFAKQKEDRLFLDCFYQALGVQEKHVFSEATRAQFRPFHVMGSQERGGLLPHSTVEHAIFSWQTDASLFPQDGKHPCGGPLPTFIHIPKTGGEAMEVALKKRGILAGSRADWSTKASAPYPTQNIGVVPIDEKFHYCSPWHRPPSQPVPFGVCVVRDPLERLISEFCYSQDLIPQWFPGRRFASHCQGFNDWTDFVLERYAQDAVLDCHVVPQWEYASRAEIVLPFAGLLPQNNQTTWRTLSRLYGLPPQALPADNVAAPACKRALSETKPCLTPENEARWKQHFADDYRYLSHCFGNDNDGMASHFGCHIPART